MTAHAIKGSASVIDKEGPDGLVGDELIDAGLYFGSERPADAGEIRYVQLKLLGAQGQPVLDACGNWGDPQGFGAPLMSKAQTARGGLLVAAWPASPADCP